MSLACRPRQRGTQLYTLLISLSCLIVFRAFAAGPFGFEYGMPKEQVIAAVGQDAVIRNRHAAEVPARRLLQKQRQLWPVIQ